MRGWSIVIRPEVNQMPVFKLAVIKVEPAPVCLAAEAVRAVRLLVYPEFLCVRARLALQLGGELVCRDLADNIAAVFARGYVIQLARLNSGPRSFGDRIAALAVIGNKFYGISRSVAESEDRTR